ncbi:MAG: hypothetical protein AB7W16_04795 [Candidatus Obscuribacterales bacterium]
MNEKKLRTLAMASILTALSVLAATAAEEYLLDELEAYREKRNISSEQFHDQLFQLFVDGPILCKGRCGLIGSDTYVLMTDRNALRIKGKDWRGKPRSSTEVVLIDDSRVLAPGDPVDKENLTVVVFMPDQIKVINYKDKTAGHFNRPNSK